MSAETVRRISEMLRAARESGASTDPEFFDRKAALFDRIASEDQYLGGDAAELAEQARVRARDLRRSGGAR